MIHPPGPPDTGKKVILVDLSCNMITCHERLFRPVSPVIPKCLYASTAYPGATYARTVEQHLLITLTWL